MLVKKIHHKQYYFTRQQHTKENIKESHEISSGKRITDHKEVIEQMQCKDSPLTFKQLCYLASESSN